MPDAYKTLIPGDEARLAAELARGELVNVEPAGFRGPEERQRAIRGKSRPFLLLRERLAYRGLDLAREGVFTWRVVGLEN